MKLWPFSKKEKHTEAYSDELPPGVMLLSGGMPEISFGDALPGVSMASQPQPEAPGSSEPQFHMPMNPAPGQEAQAGTDLHEFFEQQYQSMLAGGSATQKQAETASVPVSEPLPHFAPPLSAAPDPLLSTPEVSPMPDAALWAMPENQIPAEAPADQLTPAPAETAPELLAPPETTAWEPVEEENMDEGAVEPDPWLMGLEAPEFPDEETAEATDTWTASLPDEAFSAPAANEALFAPPETVEPALESAPEWNEDESFFLPPGADDFLAPLEHPSLPDAASDTADWNKPLQTSFPEAPASTLAPVISLEPVEDGWTGAIESPPADLDSYELGYYDDPAGDEPHFVLDAPPPHSEADLYMPEWSAPAESVAVTEPALHIVPEEPVAISEPVEWPVEDMALIPAEAFPEAFSRDEPAAGFPEPFAAEVPACPVAEVSQAAEPAALPILPPPAPKSTFTKPVKKARPAFIPTAEDYQPYTGSIADELSSLKQSSLLEDSRAIKRSIDHLVEQYFSRQERELSM